MRLAAVSVAACPGGCRAIGVVADDLRRITVLDPDVGTVDDVVRSLVSIGTVADAAALVAPVPIDEVTLLAPLQHFNRDVLCTGWNYLDHFAESLGKRSGQGPLEMPEHPTFFTKGPDTIIGPFEPISFDAEISKCWDYEAELALVIGRDGRSIDEADAMGHVFGYMLANDVSQRDLQRAHGGQWLKGKSLDATMPLGPWITTTDDVDPSDLLIECEVNGELRQHASTAEMAFSISRIIAELSNGMTLRAGDVILTGTPSGIGSAREPAIYLREGDVVVTRIAGLGEMSNVLRTAEARHLSRSA